MSVVVDTGLTSAAVIGRFYRRLEELASAAWWTRLAMQFSSTQESETYRWLGMVPQVREWKGGRLVQPLRRAGTTIVNKVWEATIRVDADEFRRDKSGQIMVRINELARRVATHPNRLLTQLMLNGESAHAYDGAPYFGTHSEGDSGSQSNLITVDVATPAAPTDAEMYGAIVRGISTLMGLHDDQGEPMNESASQFMVVVPMTFLAPTLIALSSRNFDANDNPLTNRRPFSVEWVANPRLTWTDRFAIFRIDGDARPFIFQEELPVQVHALAEGSELEANENQHQYGVKAIHECGYGFWQNACLVQLT
jgi:hypothetical protein